MYSNPFIEQLYGTMPKEEYMCIKCPTCQGIFRWGRRHDWQWSCAYCGTWSFSKPHTVSRQEYVKWLETLGTVEAMQELQKVLWSPHYIDDY